MTKARVYTREEVQEKFLNHMRNMIEFWDSYDEKTAREKLEGMMFTVMAVLDGASIDLPGFAIIPRPHPDDKEYCMQINKNWFPDDVDIGGDLHDRLKI